MADMPVADTTEGVIPAVTSREASVTDWIAGRKMLAIDDHSIRTTQITTEAEMALIATDFAEGTSKDTVSTQAIADNIVR